MTEKDQMLASEFALGVLDKADMATAQHRFDNDLAFRRLVEECQSDLAPMLDEVAPISPDRKVWEEIVAQTIASGSEKSRLWTSLAFWRGFSFASGAFATAVIAWVLFLSPAGLFVPKETSAPLVASLNATGKQPAFLARFDPNSGGLAVRVSLKPDQASKVAELWLIPADGVPRSLGVLNKTGQALIKIDDNTKTLFANGGTLAVSIEPQGGSPTGKPTGPVVASGKLQFL